MHVQMLRGRLSHRPAGRQPRLCTARATGSMRVRRPQPSIPAFDPRVPISTGDAGDEDDDGRRASSRRAWSSASRTPSCCSVQSGSTMEDSIDLVDGGSSPRGSQHAREVRHLGCRDAIDPSESRSGWDLQRSGPSVTHPPGWTLSPAGGLAMALWAQPWPPRLLDTASAQPGPRLRAPESTMRRSRLG